MQSFLCALVLCLMSFSAFAGVVSGEAAYTVSGSIGGCSGMCEPWEPQGTNFIVMVDPAAVGDATEGFTWAAGALANAANAAGFTVTSLTGDPLNPDNGYALSWSKDGESGTSILQSYLGANNFWSSTNHDEDTTDPLLVSVDNVFTHSAVKYDLMGNPILLPPVVAAVDYSTLTSAVDFSSVVVAILAIFASLVVLGVAFFGGRSVLAALGFSSEGAGLAPVVYDEQSGGYIERETGRKYHVQDGEIVPDDGGRNNY